MIYGVIFFTSLAVLGYEITFTRVFSFAQWHNLSSVIITMALLGSGGAGTAVTLSDRFIQGRRIFSIFAGSILLPVFMASAFIISESLPLNPYELSFSIRQVFYISIYFLMMALPFFAGSVVICVSFMEKPPSGAYAANLIGSGAGAALPLVLSYYLHPYSIMAVMITISLIPAVIVALYRGRRYIAVSLAAVCIIIPLTFAITGNRDFRRVSQYKPISGALNLPGAKIIHEAYSPLSVMQLVEAEGLRSTSGLSLVSPYQVPVQRVIFFDGDSPAAVTPFGSSADIRYISYLSSWLPYYMKSREEQKSVLIIGAGGGESILKALHAGFTEIDAVEVNSNVISLMKEGNAEYSGGIFLKNDVSIYNEEGRSFVRRSAKKYDLIDIPMLDAFNSAASGVYSLNESYLYTVESFRDFYRCLSPRGIISVTRWYTTPPRDSLKVFNTAAESLRKMNIDPSSRIIAVRSLQTVTFLISAAPYTAGEIKTIRKYCTERLFDMVYYPGIKPGIDKSFIKEQDESLRNSLTAILSPESEKFIESYICDISTPDDNRPYFYNFFKPAFLKYIIQFGPSQIPVTEWGYLLLIIILMPVAVISFLCIVLPALYLRQKGSFSEKWLIPYFSLIAPGFFFIEMPMIQKMILFLGSPVFSLGIIISSLLIFSGAGSFFSDYLFRSSKGILKVIIIICSVMMFYILTLDRFFLSLIHLQLPLRITLVVLLIAPPAFFMGMPFPKGLSMLKESNQSAIPLAWGVNGFFSVISIISAAIFAVIWGYRVVLLSALACYMAAGIISLSPGGKRGSDISSS